MEKHPIWESVIKREPLESAPDKKQGILLVYRMLTFPLRKFVIEEIKAPLEKAIITAKKTKDVFKVLISVNKKFKDKFGEITKGTTVYRNTHNLMDIRDKFFKYFNNPCKEPMFQAGWNMYIGECEHDRFYRYLDEWMLEEKVKMILSGQWQPRLEGWPEPKYWKEPAPYGGEYSIVYKLQAHREEILKIIGES